jgi:hypothetical protein
MRHFKYSTELNNAQGSPINTFDINLQQLRTRRRQMFSYNNKTKDQYHPRVYSIPIKQDESYVLRSNQLSSINNIVSIPTNTPNPSILSSQEK